MARFLIINQPWFSNELRKLGHYVRLCLKVEEIAKFRDDNWDYIIYHDDSCPVLATEFLEWPSGLKFYYAVDVHLHWFEQRLIGAAFDGVFVAQKDYVKRFQPFNPNVIWLPLFSHKLNFVKSYEYPAVFIGHLDRDIHQPRKKFLESIAKILPLRIMTGDWTVVYPKTLIVVNKSIADDLNFRVFEALSCNCLLITDKSASGIQDLFVDGKDLVLYSDLHDCVEKLSFFLENVDLAKNISNNGYKKFLLYHSAEHRINEMIYSIEHRLCKNDLFNDDIRFKLLTLGKSFWLYKIAKLRGNEALHREYLSNITAITRQLPSSLLKEIEVF